MKATVISLSIELFVLSWTKGELFELNFSLVFKTASSVLLCLRIKFLVTLFVGTTLNRLL